ncbi:MAG: 3' terminal RNA ribose 2'-O-methyltransferase Hen1 [Holophagales bacterium]|jgi:3' terminal RNA ribose 2'-O-methyltransferase Hen1|nr:3' terminal RNA ribose 2'-O-methyltransferase Hen1 [Holophagales bacterium]
MLLTITYIGQDTTDLGHLLHKNPYRPQVFELSHGKAFVFYPEISNERTTAALLLDIDPIDLARGKVGSTEGGLFDYVNDRPYASSSFLSTAISSVFGTAMAGRSSKHQELADTPLNLTATVTMLPCRGEQEKLKCVFEPLGYEVDFEAFVSDEAFPHWGGSKYVNLTIRGMVRLCDLLRHLYVLIPVFDRQKHYWVGPDEVEKLLSHSKDWLPNHPEKEYITGSLYRRRSLVNMAFERLSVANAADGEVLGSEAQDSRKETDEHLTLNKQRLGSVVAALKSCGARRVIDLGCGEGNLLNLLVKERQFSNITGVDVSHVALERASERMKLESAGDYMRQRVQLFQGSLTYRDERFAGHDAACVIEVIEHLDIPRLAAFERVLFEFAKPSTVVLTTPNQEYNAIYERLGDGERRHSDHRFEWTRAEFRDWASKVGETYGYSVRFSEIGDIDEKCGAPTQMGVFTLCG